MLLAAVASASVVAAAGALLVVGEARVKTIPGLAVAVFGTFLTSMAIIAAFSIEERSRWPTPWEALDRAHVPIWFVVALASVVTALLAGALDSSFLSSFSLALALVAVPLGTLGLWGLISLSSDQGRWGLVVDLLAGSILEAGREDRPRSPDLGEIDTEDHVPASFLIAGTPSEPQRTGVSLELVPGTLREYADRRDLEAIMGLIDEVHAGARQAFGEGDSIDFDVYLGSVDSLLHVQRQMFAELAARVLSGQLGDATARIALARAGQAVVDAAGRARQLEAPPGHEPGGQVEALVARQLTALSRLAGATALEAEAQIENALAKGTGGAEMTRAVALRAVCFDLQQEVRWAVDPDPPGMKMPPDHVWLRGLSGPESALAWLWSAAESRSGPFGVGLYATCQILTGKKFVDSYWDGFDVLTEVERRLHGAGEEDLALAAGREAVARAGGLPLLSLELAAARLAATPRRESGEPAFQGDPARDDDRHVACNLFLAGAGYKPHGRDPIADLAWLLTDRLRGSLWTLVYDHLSELPDAVVSPPLRPLHSHADACALAVCLRLAPLGADPDGSGLRAAERFASRLPEPLLERAVSLALGLTSAERTDPAGDRAGRERQLVDASRFARKVAPTLPSPPPEEGTTTTPVGRKAGSAPELKDVAVAIHQIATAKSEIEVDLIQCDPRWLEEWSDARADLDAALLSSALNGVAQVRRIVRFDLARDADRRATRLHYRWTEALATAVGCFQHRDRAATAESRYKVRLLVVPGAERDPAVPEDCVAIRGAGAGLDSIPERVERFDALWERIDRGARSPDALGLIEMGASGSAWAPRRA